MALYDSENNRLLDTDDNVLTARVGFTVGNKEIQKQYIGTNEVKAIYLGTNLIYEKLFNIFVSVTNGTYDGASQIIPGGVSQVRIIPNGNYTFPLSVTVSGATSSYNATTGVITLSNVTSDVTISATCPLALTQLDAPVISLDNDTLTIEEVENAEYYDIYVDGVLEESVPAVSYEVTFSKTIDSMDILYDLSYFYIDYSLDNGTTWIPVTESLMGTTITNATQIKVRVFAEGTIGASIYLNDTQTLLIESWDDGLQVSQNITLSDNIDLIVEFEDD